MKQLYTSDQLIIKGILSSDDDALKHIYKQYYEMILSLVTNNSGTKEEAEDILQDGIIVFYEKIKEGTLKLTCSITTYIYSVCRNLWLNKLKEKKQFIELKDFHDKTVEVNYEIEKDNVYSKRQQALSKFINLIGEGCKKLLIYFYYDKLSMSDIAKKMGYKSADYAKTQKYRCIKKLKDMIKLKSQN